MLALYDDFCKKNNYENHYSTFFSFVYNKFKILCDCFKKKYKYTI